MENEYATIRVIPINEDDDIEEEKAMEYEYTLEEDLKISKLLEKLESDGLLHKTEITGNAMCIEADNKETLTKLYNDIKTALPHLNMGIEYNYWIE